MEVVREEEHRKQHDVVSAEAGHSSRPEPEDNHSTPIVLGTGFHKATVDLASSA